MATNNGVIILKSSQLKNTKMNERLDIEDNIGEGIHIHYKNFRIDYTIEEFLSFAKACKQALNSIEK